MVADAKWALKDEFYFDWSAPVPASIFMARRTEILRMSSGGG